MNNNENVNRQDRLAKNNEHMLVASDESLMNELVESGDYILIEYVGKKSSRRFVGQVNEVKKEDNELEYKVHFLRKRNEGFLSQPMIHGRGQLKFSIQIKTTD